ncbi:MAG TPA: hypothetical protein VKR06_40480 [Ktedonosporobacter sp.]|nr:hypothetical protein [Ktedonosporobacter sp.]
MLPYPPSIKRDTPERSLLRVLGGVLASLSMLLALLGIIFYQRVVDLILAIIVGIFAVRVLLLWLGNKPQHQQPLPEWSSRERYSMQASPYSQSRPLSQLATKQHMQHSVPVPPVPDAPLSPKLPRSIRPQKPPEAPMFPARPISAPPAVQPLPPSQPPSLWSPPLSAPASGPSRQEIWQYDDGKNSMQ